MPTLIIGGMHRSGTTLTARWLHQCGLYVGDDLLTSKFSHANPDGNHYEDRAFLKLHRQILLSNGLNAEGYITNENIQIAPQYRAQAEALIASRQIYEQWGWKEPRTSLFMDFWQPYLPDVYALMVYRPYTRVADSLLRRKLEHPRRVRRWFYRMVYHNRAAHVAHFICVWRRYNRDLLTFAARTPERTLVLRIDDLVRESEAIVHFMNSAWAFQLDTSAASHIFQRERLKQETRYVNREAPLVANAMQAAEPLYQQLEQWRVLTLKRIRNQAVIDD